MHAARSDLYAETPSHPSLFQRSVLWLTLSALIAQPVTVSAQVIAASAGAYKPQVDAAANGVPLIQITAPSAAGVSRNQYQQYNVSPQGVILNNSSVVVSTQQAGFVAGNPNLAAGTARVILNEVTSSLPSSLRGYTEVGGAKAEVIIANPNGITCDGCGFINTSRGVLTTGTPVLGAGGSLDAFRVSGGQITIQGAGLNANNIDQIDLIARAVQVNAGLWGQNLNVVTGANQVAYADLGTQAIAGSGTAPTVAIDVALLGGMYAGKIRLVGTEAGVGVVSAGTLAASAGDLSIDSAGRISLSGSTQATGRIDLNAPQDISNSGSLYGQQNVTVTSGGLLTNSGSLIAQGDLVLTAASVDATGILAAGIDSLGKLSQAGQLRVATVGSLRAVGQNLAGGDLVLTGGTLNLAAAQTSAGGNIALTATNGDLDHTGGVLQSGRDLALSASGAILNDQGQLLAGQTLSSRSASFSNRNGQVFQNASANSQIATSGQFDNRAGSVVSNGNTVLTVGDLDNRGGTVQAQGSADLSITASGRVDNSAGGKVWAAGTLQLAAVDLGNSQGQMSAGQDLNVSATQTLDNRQGTLAATRNVSVNALSINNAGGLIGAVTGSTTLNATGGALDTTGGRIEAALALALTATGLDDTDGVLIGQNVRIDSRQQSFNNTRGQLVASGTLAIQSGALTNTGGLIQSAGALAMDTHGQRLSNTLSAGGGILGQSTVTLNTGDIDNQGGTVLALGGGDLTITANGRVDNGAGGQLGTGGTLRLSAAELANVQGQIAAGQNLSITTTQAIDNSQGTLAATGDVNLSASGINNTNGAIGALGGSTTATATGGVIDNTGGRLWAGQNLTLAANTVANQDGRLYAAQDVSLTANSMTGNGTLLADRDLTIRLDGSYTQSASNSLQANRNLSFLLTGDLINQGLLSAVGNLTVGAANIDNQNGATLQGDSANLTASHAFGNTGAVLANTVNLQADSLINTGSIFGQNLTVTANTLTNQGSGVIAAGTTLNLYIANTLNNLDGGLLYSAGDLAIAAGAHRDSNGWLDTPTGYVLNRSADIEAGRDLEITAGTVDNQRTSVVTATRTLSSTTTLAQHKDGAWDGSLVGQVFINGSAVNVTTTIVTCDTLGANCTSDTSSQQTGVGFWPAQSNSAAALGTTTSGPVLDCSAPFGVCHQVTTMTTTTVANPFGADYWHLPVENVPTFTLFPSAPYRRSVFISDQLQDYVVSATPEARMLAGRDIYLRAGTVNNNASRIEATGNLLAEVITLNNTGYTLYNKDHNTAWHGNCSDIQGDEAGSLGSCNSGWIWTMAVSDTITSINTSLDAVFRGGQSLSLSAITVNNRTVDAQGLPPGGVNLTVNSTAHTATTSVTPAAATGYTATPYVFSVPVGGLYSVHSAPGYPYLVETDPRFTQFAHFISSDYMLSRLGLDPALIEKRLGDGYYEQQLVRDQLINQRGKSSLGGYASLDAEYQALLDAGVAYAQAFAIVPGVTLSKDQVASLAHDMVWLEERVVDGQRVLVPVVYLAQVSATGETRAVGAIIGGGVTTQISAVDINNSGSIVASGQTTLNASHDITNDSGQISGQNIALTAGNDLHLGTATQSVTLAPGQTFTREGLAGRVDGQNVSLSAGRDLTLAGGQIQAGDATLTAGRDLTIGTQTLATEQHLQNGDSRYDRSATTERTSQIVTSGDLTLSANHDLAIVGSDLKSGGSLSGSAGNDLILQAAQDQESVAYNSQNKRVTDIYQSASSRARTSTLDVGQSLSLTAGGVLASEGATLRAKEDIALAATTIVLDAAHDRQSSAARYSSTGTGGQQQAQSQIDSDSARGGIVDAGRKLSITSSGDTTVVGSALAAGQSATIKTGGNLALLAAQSSHSADIQASGSTRTSATSLTFSEREVRQLLTTITVGQGLDLQVGGNFQADTGERRADGTLNADRMTTAGIVRGDSRQQVSVTRTGDGANANPADSQVLGNLAAQGIRNGSNESFAPTAANAPQNGSAALQQYLASGLVQIKSSPQVAGQLQAVLQNGNGSTLTYKDASGKVSLTVAGQAQVQAVYNTLKLTETYDVKHFADQGTAQIVTLVAAIALTVMTAGAGASSIGVAMAGQGVTATMINAAVVAMASTMTGQLAAGASFDQAFEAGLKAGASSAITAGILNAPVIDSGAPGMQSINQLANVQTTGANIVGSFNADTFAQNLGGMALRGVVNASVSTAIYGGSFGDAFKSSLISDLAAVGANAVGQAWGGGVNPAMQTLANAGVGAAAAKLQGKDVVAGAIGAASETILGNLVDLPVDPQTGQYSEATKGGYQLAAMLVGAGAAAAADKDGLTAALAAQNAAVNNRLMTQVEKDRIKQLTRETGITVGRLGDAVCAFIKCSAQYLSTSPEYAKAIAQEQRGGDDYVALEVLRKAILANPEFLSYGRTDKAIDKTKLSVQAVGATVGEAAIGVGKGFLEFGKQAQEGLLGGVSPADVPNNFPVGTPGVTSSYVNTPDVTTPSNEIQKDFKDATVVAGTAALIIAPGLGERGVGEKEVATIIETKIAQQMGTRGWSAEAIESVITSPAKTVVTRDTRFDPVTGTRLNDPATGYISQDGAYIVRNDRTGQVVQVSNKNDPTWKAPWDK